MGLLKKIYCIYGANCILVLDVGQWGHPYRFFGNDDILSFPGFLQRCPFTEDNCAGSLRMTLF